jgi:general secretion pathway protein C
MTLGKLAIRVVNAVLFTLCCYWTAALVSAWIGAGLVARPIVRPPSTTTVSAPGREWSDRQAILDRNLFRVSTLLPAPAVAVESEPEEEGLEATRLPLRLLGTVASADADAAYAAVEDQQTRKRSVVRVGEGLLDSATVLRIERRRIVIQNGSNREELALDDEKELRQQEGRRLARAARTPGPVADGLRERIQKLSETSFAASRKNAGPAGEEASQPLAGARVLPKYEQGQMTGVQVSSIDRGSLFEDLGIQDGDTVTQVNGIIVTGPQDSVAALRELTEASEFQVNVIGADGQSRTLTHSLGRE